MNQSTVRGGGRVLAGLVTLSASFVTRPTMAAVAAPATSLALVGGADDCAVADVIAGAGPFAFDTTAATTGAFGQSEVACLYAGTTSIANDVWFTWTAPFSGPATLSTCGQTTMDSKAAVYVGSSCSPVAALACNDDACSSTQSSFTWTVSSGTPYLIQIGNFPGGSAGVGTFTITAVAPPPNDDCSAATSISGPGPFPFDSTLATRGSEGQTETICTNGGQAGIDRDVWFVWTATFSGVAEATTCGLTAFDTKMAVYAGGNCPASGSAIDCDDDSCGAASRQSLVDFPCSLGSVYLIQVGSPPGGGGGSGGVSIAARPCPAPPGDVCTASSRKLSGCATKVTNTFCANPSSPDPSTACVIGGIGNDVWYSWTAPTNGSYDFQLCSPANTSPTYTPKLVIYAGPSGPNCPGAALACGTPCVGGEEVAAFNATINTTYMIEIGGDFTGLLGNALLKIKNEGCNDECDGYFIIPGGGGGGGGGSSGYNSAYLSTGTTGQANLSCAPGGNPAIERDGWWAWVAPCTGTAQASTCGLTAIDTRIAVYDGVGCPSGMAIACNDDACGSASLVTWSVVGGQTYTLQVGSSPGAGIGTAQFTVSCTSAVGFCFGDGSGTACPCANNGSTGNGCANSVNAAGAHLAASGGTSISADTFVLSGSGMPASTCLYFQGTSQVAGGNGAVFGDGLRCAAGTVIRLGTKTNAGGASQYPGVGDPAISVRGMVPGGATRAYQAWYRNAAAFCTVSTFNLTNGVSTTWTP